MMLFYLPEVSRAHLFYKRKRLWEFVQIFRSIKGTATGMGITEYSVL